MNDGSQVEYEKAIKITGFCLILASIIQVIQNYGLLIITLLIYMLFANR